MNVDWNLQLAEQLDLRPAAGPDWHARRADGLGRPCGPAEDPYGGEPMAMLVLHINREVIHHGAQIALLRDLYQRHVGLTA